MKSRDACAAQSLRRPKCLHFVPSLPSWMAVVVGTPCDWRETAMLQAAPAAMDNLLMGAAAMSNLLMSTTRATSRLRHTASTSTSSFLIDHVSALEYATECATSEASNTVFTAQTSFAVLQALQAATTAVQPSCRHAVTMRARHRQRPDARPPASERELKQTEATASASADTAGACA